MPQNDNAAAMAPDQLLAATRPFAKEIRYKSWWVLVTTMTILGGLLGIAAIAPWWPVRLVSALTASLVMVRGFIIYHDYVHGAIFRKSKIAGAILRVYGLLYLVGGFHYWRHTHNFHHANVATLEASSVGSFPIMTVEQWRNAPRLKRFHYRVARNPMTIVLAYITVFFFSSCLEPFIRNPLKAWHTGLGIVLHGGVIAGLWLLGGPWTAFYGFVLPYAVAAALGAYLFYAQHNFPGMQIMPQDKWNMHEAALKASSFAKLNPVMDWMTGSIGYHHIHHVNPTIPFYRLREAMQNIPALQNPVVTTLKPRDIWACLRLKIWDDAQGRMITFGEAKRQLRTAA
jgi:omega-6 fatty acid desaturase (delta-12 desaturase)